MKILSSFTQLISLFCKTQKQIFWTIFQQFLLMQWISVRSKQIPLIFIVVQKKRHLKIYIYLVFHRRKKVIQVWNNMRVSKWVNYKITDIYYLKNAPGVCSLCVCVHCVCVHFGWDKCRAQILSMGHHTLPRHITFTFLSFKLVRHLYVLKVSYAHKSCIYFMKNTVKTVIL